MGTQRQMGILDRVADKKVLSQDFVRLQDVGWTMTDASLCGLGQTAASAVLSAMKLWPELFAETETAGPVEKQQVKPVKKASGSAKAKAKSIKKVVKAKPVKKPAAKKSAVKKVVKPAKPKTKKSTAKKSPARKSVKKR